MDAAAILREVSMMRFQMRQIVGLDKRLNDLVTAAGWVPSTRKVNNHALSSDVTVSKGDVGLGNCDNTSDVDKPISTVTQTALDGKAPLTVAVTAGEALGGHRIVYKADDGKVYYADCSQTSHRHRIVGLTTGAISNGAAGTVQRFGAITEPSWSWTMGLPVFLSTGGLLIQTPPVSVFLLEIGFPLTTTSLFIDFKMSITLAA